MYLKACITGQTGASHLGWLPGNEVYRCSYELVNVLAKMLDEKNHCLTVLGFSPLSSRSFLTVACPFQRWLGW